MKLSTIYERTRKINGKVQTQVLEICSKANTLQEVKDLSYDDFKANLYINDKLIADISWVLDNAGVFSQLVDETDWEEQFKENQIDTEYL